MLLQPEEMQLQGIFKRAIIVFYARITYITFPTTAAKWAYP